MDPPQLEYLEWGQRLEHPARCRSSPGGRSPQERLAQRQSCTGGKFSRDCFARGRRAGGEHPQEEPESLQGRSRAATSRPGGLARPGGLEPGGGCLEEDAPTVHQALFALLRP